MSKENSDLKDQISSALTATLSRVSASEDGLVEEGEPPLHGNLTGYAAEPWFTSTSKQIEISVDRSRRTGTATKVKPGGDLLFDSIENKGALCSNWVMVSGRSYAELDIVKSEAGKVFFGVARPRTAADAETGLSNNEWGIVGHSNGQFCHVPLHRGVVGKGDPAAKHGVDWEGQESFGEGDTIGLLLDSDRGEMTVYKRERNPADPFTQHRRRLGVASRTLPKNEPLFGWLTQQR